MNEPAEKNKIGIKILIVILAVSFITAAAVIALNREQPDTVVKEIEVDNTDAENDLLRSLVPSMPEAVSFNGLTRPECEAAVKDGSMILLRSKNNASVYINNYHDDELLRKAAEDGDDLNSWLSSGYAVFDVDMDLVRRHYSETLDKYIDYIKNTEGKSLQAYLNSSGISSDDFLSDQMQAAYNYICDLEMTEAMLSDTVGDVTEEEIAELAKEYDLTTAEDTKRVKISSELKRQTAS